MNEPCTDALCPATFEHIHVTEGESFYRADDEVRGRIISLTGYAPGSRTVQAFMEVVTAYGKARTAEELRAAANWCRDRSFEAEQHLIARADELDPPA